MWPVLCEWLQVVKLQVVNLATSLAALVDVAATTAVALKHFATNSCRDVAASRASRRLRADVLAWRTVRFTALARCRIGLTALVRRLACPFAAASPTGSRLRCPKPALFKRSNEQSHCFEVHGAKGQTGATPRKQRFGSVDKLSVLFGGAELQLVVLRAGYRWKVSRRWADWQRRIRKWLCWHGFRAGFFIARPIARPFTNRKLADPRRARTHVLFPGRIESCSAEPRAHWFDPIGHLR